MMSSGEALGDGCDATEAASGVPGVAKRTAAAQLRGRYHACKDVLLVS